MNTDNQQERLSFETGWAVGVWESEGWISLRSCSLPNGRFQRYRPEAGVTNTDPIVLDSVETILKSLGLAYWRTKWESQPGKKSRSAIVISGVKRCQRFVEVLGPLFKSKRDRIQILREFITYRMSVPGRAPYEEKERAWFERLRFLNAPLSSRNQNPQRLYAESAEERGMIKSEPCRDARSLAEMPKPV